MKKLLFLSIALLTVAGSQAKHKSCIQGVQNSCDSVSSTVNSVCVPLLGGIAGYGKPGHCVTQAQWQKMQKVKQQKSTNSVGSSCIVGQRGACGTGEAKSSNLTCVPGTGAVATRFGLAGTCQYVIN
jgi:hypothetical protein